MEPPTLDVEGGWEARSGLPTIALAGEVDLAAAPELRRRLQALVEAGHRSIVVDLLDVTFVDSTALGALVVGRELCAAAGGNLHLVVADRRILRVLEITGLDQVFPLHATRVLP